ncbi:uncharacterized protein LKV04_020535 [Tautogolabrus adspersus]
MARYRDPHLPLSSLHLLIPPLRLMSACLWQVALERNVDKYDKLAEYITLVTEIVPDLLIDKQRIQLILGLRARIIVELLTKADPIDCKAVEEHLNLFQKTCNQKGQDREVKISKSAFVKQVQTLLKDKYEKDTFVKKVFPELYGARFDTVLQILVWEFLYRLEEFLPVPSFSKVSSFIDLSSFDSRFEQFFCDQDDLKKILQHQKQRKKLTKSEFSFMSDTILSTLASKQTSVASEGHIEGVTDEKGGDSTDEETNEETDDSSVELEPSNSQWQGRGLSPLTNSPCSEEGGVAGDDDNANSLLPQSIISSQTVAYKTQNSEDLAANTTGVQESGSTSGFKLNLASTLKDIADLTCPAAWRIPSMAQQPDAALLAVNRAVNACRNRCQSPSVSIFNRGSAPGPLIRKLPPFGSPLRLG